MAGVLEAFLLGQEPAPSEETGRQQPASIASKAKANAVPSHPACLSCLFPKVSPFSSSSSFLSLLDSRDNGDKSLPSYAVQVSGISSPPSSFPMPLSCFSFERKRLRQY